MLKRCHAAHTHLHPHGIYNLRDASYVELESGVVHRIEGVMRADSPEAYLANHKWPNLPLSIFVLASYTGSDYAWINAELYRRIEAGESLLNLDFTRTPGSSRPN